MHSCCTVVLHITENMASKSLSDKQKVPKKKKERRKTGPPSQRRQASVGAIDLNYEMVPGKIVNSDNEEARNYEIIDRNLMEQAARTAEDDQHLVAPAQPHLTRNYVPKVLEQEMPGMKRPADSPIPERHFRNKRKSHSEGDVLVRKGNEVLENKASEERRPSRLLQQKPRPQSNTCRQINTPSYVRLEDYPWPLPGQTERQRLLVKKKVYKITY